MGRLKWGGGGRILRLDRGDLTSDFLNCGAWGSLEEGDGRWGKERRKGWAPLPHLHFNQSRPFKWLTQVFLLVKSPTAREKGVENHPSSSWGLNPFQSHLWPPQEGSLQPGPWIVLGLQCHSHSARAGPFHPSPLLFFSF